MATQAAVDPPKRRGKITDDERARIVDLIHEGHSCGDIARQVGRDKSTVSRIAAAEGLDFDRSRTQVATAAKQADSAARLAAFSELLIDDMERLRRQLWEPCVVYAFGGKNNDFNEAQIPEPDFGAKRNIMTSIGIATDKVLAIRKAEAGPGEAAGLIVDLVSAIRGDR